MRLRLGIENQNNPGLLRVTLRMAAARTDQYLAAFVMIPPLLAAASVMHRFSWCPRSWLRSRLDSTRDDALAQTSTARSSFGNCLRASNCELGQHYNGRNSHPTRDLSLKGYPAASRLIPAC